MTEDDQIPGAPQQFPPPPPPPPGQPPVPAQPYQPAYAPQPAPAQPAPLPVSPKKSRKGLVIGIILAVILVVGAAAFLYVKSQSDRKATVDEFMQEAESVFAGVTADLDDLDALWLEVDSANDGDYPATMTAFESSATPIVDGAIKDLEGLEDSLGDLPDSPLKEALSDTLEEMQLALEAMQRMIATVSGDAPFLQAVDDSSALAGEASKLLGDAIDKSNVDDYEGARADAKSATSRYRDALAKLEAVADTYPDRETEKLIAIMQLNLEQADAASKAIDYADKGNFSKYDEMVDRYVALNDEIDAAEFPAWIDDPTLLLADFQGAYDEFTAHADKGAEALTRAEERYDSGQY